MLLCYIGNSRDELSAQLCSFRVVRGLGQNIYRHKRVGKLR